MERGAERERRSTAVLVGRPEDPVRELLADALCELDVTVHADPGMAPFDVVIAVFARDNLKRVLSEAKLLAGDAPILAVMSMADDDCEELALQSGAAAYWALEWPITRLRGLVVAMVGRRRLRSSN